MKWIGQIRVVIDVICLPRGKGRRGPAATGCLALLCLTLLALLVLTLTSNAPSLCIFVFP